MKYFRKLIVIGCVIVLSACDLYTFVGVRTKLTSPLDEECILSALLDNPMVKEARVDQLAGHKAWSLYQGVHTFGLLLISST